MVNYTGFIENQTLSGDGQDENSVYFLVINPDKSA